jgi:hypothetical protein
MQWQFVVIDENLLWGIVNGISTSIKHCTFFMLFIKRKHIPLVIQIAYFLVFLMLFVIVMKYHVEARGTYVGQLASFSQTIYDVNFKLKGTRCAEEMNSGMALRNTAFLRPVCGDGIKATEGKY